MMGKILAAWRIISGTGIYNRRRDTLRLRLIGLRSSAGISVWGEPLEARRTLSDFQGPSGLSLLTGTAPNILYVLAVDCVVAATGPKLFVDQIEADIGQSYGVSHSTISKL